MNVARDCLVVEGIGESDVFKNLEHVMVYEVTTRKIMNTQETLMRSW